MGRVTRVAVFVMLVFAVACASATARPRSPFQVNLGVSLSGSGPGVCAVQAPDTARRCTLAEVERFVDPEEGPMVPGHIVLYRLYLRSDAAMTHATGVQVRLRVLSGPNARRGAVGPWQSVDLEGPRKQEFPVSVPFVRGDRVALDMIVEGDGTTEAAAPIARAMSAVFERDDRVGPHLRVRYAPRQNFLDTGRVEVEVHSDSAGTLNPECSLLSGEAQWGLLFDSRRLRPGGWIRFSCHFYGAPLRVARQKASRGGHPLVMVHPIAYDRAGNRGALPKIYLRP
ncbi:MAG: hypothetical protein JST53_09685 [Actinobacteria bacterium]|nr:hypothetical protein [Actinomycetota bacterium]